MRPTHGPGTAHGIAASAIAEGADAIFAYGGDGTLNEVAEGMIGSNVPLGVLPGGTANVLANELGLGSRADRVAAQLAGCVPTRIAVGCIRTNGNGARHFLLMAGIGLDARIVYKMSASLKERLGKIAYWIGGFGQLSRELEEFDTLIDGRSIRASFALVTKVRNYGGDLEIARKVRIVDDQFEVVLFSGPNSFRYLKYFTGVATNRLDGMDGVTILRARGARFSAATDSRVYAQVDGEYAGRLPGAVDAMPDALTLLIPPAYLKK